MRLPSSRARSVFVAIAVLAAACNGSDGDGNNNDNRPGRRLACGEVSPAGDTSLLPDDIPLKDYATVVQIGSRRGFLGVASVSELKIVELVPALSRDLIAEDYQILTTDNEGFEAEIYFRRGKHLGSYRMREGPCKNQVTVRLLYRL